MIENKNCSIIDIHVYSKAKMIEKIGDYNLKVFSSMYLLSIAFIALVSLMLVKKKRVHLMV